MDKFKKILQHIFIDGLNGMAQGLFATLIVGTILQQIGSMIGGGVGDLIFQVGKLAGSLMGAGIGCGVAYKYKASPLVLLSAATAGMVGAFAATMLNGLVVADAVVSYKGPGEPLGAFVAAMVAIEVGGLVSGKTKLDIVLTPFVAICSGSLIGLLLGKPIATMMSALSKLISWGTVQQPLLMGILVAVLMGMALTLPISSAAIGVMLQMGGIAAGAAAVGCCANMVGFAVASFRDNGMGGLVAQGLGTSMLQMPNIVKKPIIWLPAIITSAILGPISTLCLGMTNNATGAGMGTSGLVGPLMAFESMNESLGVGMCLLQIGIMMFVAPAALSLLISEIMRKVGWIQPGDMKLS